MESATVLYYEVGKEVVLVVVNGSDNDQLMQMKGLVGGWIEGVRLFGQVMLICNEEGKLIGLPPNRLVGGDMIVGNFFVTAVNEEGDHIDLTADQISEVLSLMEATSSAR